MNSHSLLLIMLKWTLLVGLNAIFSLAMAWQGSNHLGLAAGIATWIALYTALEWYSYEKNWRRLRFSLWIAALLKALMQFYPVVELYSGIIAVSLCEHLFGNQSVGYFYGSYFTTVVDGLLLSLVMSLWVGISFALLRLLSRHRPASEQI